MNITHEQARYVEGYAAALQDVLYAMTGDNGCSKSYDPMTVDGNTMHSYAFDMKDGGRHHDGKDYSDLSEIKNVLKRQVLLEINQAIFSPEHLRSAARPEKPSNSHHGNRTLDNSRRKQAGRMASLAVASGSPLRSARTPDRADDAGSTCAHCTRSCGKAHTITQGVE